jgi:uncharacterized surface protein with fasciclin (FAS1) repeats
MTACGPNSQSYNFSFAFDFNDVRGPLPKRCYNKNSIMSIISNHPDFTKFNYIIKLAKYDAILDDPQANFTLFVPSDAEISNFDVTSLDVGDARAIIRSSLLNSRLPSEVLSDSPMNYYTTLSVQNRLLITNINSTTRLNNRISVLLFDILAINGMIHVTNGVIIPLKL